MRRSLTYLNALLLGMILGMLFLAIVHTIPPHGQRELRRSGIALGYRIIGANVSISLIEPVYQPIWTLRK